MVVKLDSGEIKDILKDTLEEFKRAICIVMPSMMETNIVTILRSIKDPTCLTLHPQTDNMVGLLEEFMPDEDIPAGTQVLGVVEHINPLTYDQKDLLVELFDDLEVAHDRMARVCGRMSSLAKVLGPTSSW